jgi:ribosome-associated translation inhibitor RaiA
MTLEPQISYRDVAQSPSIDRLIRTEVAKLEHFHDRILNCRVHIEYAHRRHSSPVFHVRIELSVPGEHLVVSHNDDTHPPSSSHEAAHKDVQLAVRDAFRTATSRLQDYVSRRRDLS